MLVYRDGRHEVDAGAKKLELVRVIETISHPESPPCLEALLRAAELECALADLASNRARASEELTSALAEYWLSARGWAPPPDTTRARALELPARIELRRPEGYAYYGLNPQAFAKLARDLELQGPCAVVIGIRSIGTSLSAIVRAALIGRGVPAERITVRPVGHPWARELNLTPEQEGFVLGRAGAGAHFLVVDEGPGISGSTLLAVAEALVNLGILRRQITLLCSRPFDRAELVADGAAARWHFRTLVAESLAPPSGARNLSGGAWRGSVYRSPDDWPSSWTSRERIKFRHDGSGEICKFEGYPPYDFGPRQRAELLAEAGLAPEIRAAEPGFIAHAWCQGRPACRGDMSEIVVRRLASYLAFRSRELATAETAPSELERMTIVNVGETLGSDLGANFNLPIEAPVIADGKMQPHEFSFRDDGPLVKVDAIDHGDDHLFPGPTDIAWDLAGAAVEWRLDRQGVKSLLEFYRRETGDDARSRFTSYIIAYCAFQLGCTTFALRDADAAERFRLEATRAAYERDLLAALGFAQW